MENHCCNFDVEKASLPNGEMTNKKTFEPSSRKGTIHYLILHASVLSNGMVGGEGKKYHLLEKVRRTRVPPQHALLFVAAAITD